MNSKGFGDWINWCYSEIRKKWSGPWLLTIDNCGVLESEIALVGLQTELSSPRSTAKCQPLDLGLISQSKICYRSNILRITTNIILRKQSEAWDFPASSQQGIFGIRGKFLPTIGDAMEIFNERWHATSRYTVILCRLKIQCLPKSRLERCTELLRDIFTTSSIDASDLDAPILNSETEIMERDLSIFQSLAVT